MPSNNTGLNLSTRAGEGGADVMTWGNLDRAANQLYQEQKQREQRGYNEYLAGEQALRKEFANVRSGDVPDVVAAYNDLKRAKQQILFNDKIKNDSIALAKAQQAVGEKEANFRQLVAGSQELKEVDKQINARKASHPDDFDDTKIQEHALDLNLPLKDRMKAGRLDITPYLDNSPQTDFAKIGKAAMGDKQTLPFGLEKPTADQWQIEQPQFSRYNTPTQYYDNVLRSLMTGKAAKDARKVVSSMSPADVTKIVSDFEAIPENIFKDQWGIKKEDLLEKVNTDDKVKAFAALDAMKYATLFKPEMLASKFRENSAFIDGLKDAREFKQWKEKNKITSGQADQRAYARFQREKELAQMSAPEGSAFSTFGSSAPVKLKLPSGKDLGTITNGFVTDVNGKPMSGEAEVTKENVPAAIRTLLKANGIDYNDIAPKIKVIYTNGEIKGANLGGKIGVLDDRTLGNYQLKSNTEPLKGRQPSWLPSLKKTVVAPKNDPLGIFKK
jgi:hypothetical protein